MRIPFLAKFKEERNTTPTALADFIRGADLDYGRAAVKAGKKRSLQEVMKDIKKGIADGEI